MLHFSEKDAEARRLAWEKLTQTYWKPVYAWIRARWDDLRKKMSGRLSTALVRAAAVGCTTEDAAALSAFYGPRAAEIEGAARPLAESLEAVSLCAALRERTGTSFTKALLGKNEKK